MITHAYYPEYSGAATQCHTLSKKLIKKGFKIIVFTFTNNSQLPSQEWVDGIDVRRVHVKKKGYTGLVTTFKLLFVLVREIREFKIIHFHGFNNHLLWVVWFSLIFRKRVIMKISMMDVDTPKAIMHKGLFHRIAYQHLDRIIATTSIMMDEIHDYPRLNARGVFIPNGVDTDLFHPVDENERIKLKSQLGLPISRKIIIFNGVICKRKGIDILFSAWKLLKKELNELCPLLLLVGPFESDVWENKAETDQLKQRTLELIKKYPNEVFHFGMKQKIDDYYKAANIFVLPSRNEGLPNALLEAMATGLPCIVSSFKGVNEILKDMQNRIVLKDNEPGELAKSINRLVTDKELINRIQSNSQKTVLNYFGMENTLIQYQELYQSLLMQ